MAAPGRAARDTTMNLQQWRSDLHKRWPRRMWGKLDGTFTVRPTWQGAKHVRRLKKKATQK